MSYVSYSEEVQNYMNQMNAYTDQVSEYKDMLMQTQEENKNFSESLNLEGAMPFVTALIEKGAGKLFGDGVASQISGIANPSNISNLLKGDTSEIIDALKGKVSSLVDQAVPEVKGLVSSVTENIPGNSLVDTLSEAKGLLNQVTSATESTVEPGVEAGSFTVSNPAFNANFFDQTDLADTGLGFDAAKLPAEASFDLSAPVEQFASNWMTAGKLGFDEASSFASSFTEPLPSGSLTSNVIGRVLNGQMGQIVPEQAESVLPSAQDFLGSVMSSVRSAGGSALESATSGFAAATSSASEMAGALGETALSSVASALGTEAPSITGVLSSAISAGQKATSAVASATEALGTTAEAAAGTVGAAAAEVGAGAAAEAGTEVAAGAEGGPVGLIIGGLIALGTTLADIFGHTDSAPPPPALPVLSIPTIQQGLGTSN